MKDLVKKTGLESEFLIASAATSISTKGKYAVQLKRNDYDKYDYIIGMDEMNVKNIIRILGHDPEYKVRKLLDYTNRSGSIADPWYTGDFESTYRDVLEGCQELLKYIQETEHMNVK